MRPVLKLNFCNFNKYIAKCYARNQAEKDFSPKFLTNELDKLKCLVEGEEQKDYQKVLAVFVAPFLNDTFDEAKGIIFSPEITDYQKNPEVMWYRKEFLCLLLILKN